MKVAAIVPAAGLGKRLKTKRLKPFVEILGKPLLAHTLVNLKKSFHFEEIILAVSPSQSGKIHRLLQRFGLSDVKVVVGGKTRAASVRNGVKGVSKDCGWVLVHDAARPLVTKALVKRLISSAKKSGAAICGLPATATVKKIDAKKRAIIKTEDRRGIYLAQTPQVFKKQLLLGRYQKLGRKAFQATDEAALFDGTRVRVNIVQGDVRNVKITTLEDIELMKFYLKKGVE